MRITKLNCKRKIGRENTTYFYFFVDFNDDFTFSILPIFLSEK